MKYFLGKTENQRGLTLTELLVASVLMGVVMVGAAGFSATIKRMYDTTDKQTILSMQAATVMGHIERNFVTAHGHRDTSGACLACGASTAVAADCNCRINNCPETAFHMCTANPESFWSTRTDPNNTPHDYSDDAWAIVFKPNAGGNQYDLYACVQPAGSGPGLGAAPDNGQSPCGANRRLLLNDRLQAFTMSRVVNPTWGALDFYVEVTTTVSQDPASGGDDPIDDPAFTMTTRIPLPGHSWN